MPIQKQTTPFSVGDKVKITGNCFPYMERFTNREGKVDGSVTNYSCMVKLKGAGGLRRWFDFRELEKL